jgi:hypothetical protein
MTKFAILSGWYCGQTVSFFPFVLVVVFVLDFFVCSFFQIVDHLLVSTTSSCR